MCLKFFNATSLFEINAAGMGLLVLAYSSYHFLFNLLSINVYI